LGGTRRRRPVVLVTGFPQRFRLVSNLLRSTHVTLA
jgi:hypothetical protein